MDSEYMPDPARLEAAERRVSELRGQLAGPVDEFEAALRALWAERFLGERIADGGEAADFLRYD